MRLPSKMILTVARGLGIAILWVFIGMFTLVDRAIDTIERPRRWREK